MHRAEIQSKLAFPLLVERLRAAGWISEDNGVLNEPLKAVFTFTDDTRAHGIQAIVEFLFTDWLYVYLLERQDNIYNYFSADEQEYVALCVLHYLRSSELELGGQSAEAWRNSVNHVLDAVLQSGYHLDVDSFIRFRLKTYLSISDIALDEIVEQFLTDREYEEFVTMLQFMLDSQSKSDEILHVFSTSERVWITDVNGQLIRDNDVTHAAIQASNGVDVNPEDLAMSILITKSPCQIVIHDLYDGAPWPSFAETVQRVFLGRAKSCQNCTTCSELRQAHTYMPNHRIRSVKKSQE